MFEGMKVVSKGDIAVGLVCAAVIGGAVTSIALEQLRWPSLRQPAPQRAPVIERRTATETAVLIHLPIEGRDTTCRLVMNHHAKTWSLSC